MNDLYVFFIRNDVWIYILCGLGLLWYLTEYWRARSRLRQAMFGLERESARAARNRALLFILIFSTVAGTVAYINLEIAPTLPPSLLKPPTPTPDPLLPTAPPGTGEPTTAATPTSPVAPTVTLPGDAVSPTPSPPATQGPLVVPTSTPPVLGCSPTAQINDPREGARVGGILNVFGTVDTPDFGYYELDINGPQTNGRWASLLGRRVTQPVDDGFLGGNINLSQWASGSYLIRLTVVDGEGQMTHQCVVDIMLDTSN